MKNQVLADGFQTSQNFFESDAVLKHYFEQNISSEGQAYMQDKWQQLGKEAATIMDTLSLKADQDSPKLVKRNFYGEDINEIEFHPAYEALKKIAVDSEMFRVKWEPQLRERFQTERHRLGFSVGFMYVMSECGLYCPLCMTDGVARLIDRYCSEEDKQRLLPQIATDKVEQLYTGAMFLTEKAGGSDVGANLVKAEPTEGDYYALHGEKWFCSNANAELIFALARTNPEIKGTKGLSIFLIEKTRPDGTPNDLGFIRLKDKLGVRSMASAECLLDGTIGKRIGEEGQGFKIMTEMINLSRLYNSISAIGISRRALVEAYQFLKYRNSFGTNALNHALIRTKLYELTAINHANFYITWRAVQALDAADNGDASEAELIRVLTPMVKRCTAEEGVYVVRECMELMGGMGYIEDGVMPKLFRDALVLPIWEGAGNIMTLDMLRATFKSEGLQVLFQEISKNIADLSNERQTIILAKLSKAKLLLQDLGQHEREVIEATALPLFKELTRIYQVSLLATNRDETAAAWIDPALDYFFGQWTNKGLHLVKPPKRATIEQMIAWQMEA